MRKRAVVTRRDFLARLGALGVGGAGLLAGQPALARRRVSPNDRIVTGHIGIGGMGGGHLGGFATNPQVEVAAVCDVHAGRCAAAAETVARGGGKAAQYGDFRRVLDREDIDAVVIATPDHWHAIPTVWACAAGKDVYCEKPLSLTIAEGRAMVEAARRYGRIVQVGTQQRNQSHIRHAVELVRSGRIGTLTECQVWFGTSGGGGWPADEAVPAEIDWEMWLGPAPRVPYNPARFGNFRMFWDYSGGVLTDWGTHLIDIIQWGAGVDAPRTIEAHGRYANDGIFDPPETSKIVYEYDGFTLTWSQPPPDPLPLGTNRSYGMYFEGTEGRLFVDRELYIIDPASADEEPIGEGDFRLGPGRGHAEEWLECIRSRTLPTSDVEIGHRSTSTPHLGNIAFRIGRKLTWDGAAERFVDDEEANRWLARPYRAPWHL